MEFWDRPMGFTWFLTETGQLAYSKRDVLTGEECCVCETTNGLTIWNGVHGYDFIRGWRRHRGMEKGIWINGKEGYCWSYGSAQWCVVCIEVETGIISFECGLGRFVDRWKNRLSRKSWKTGILDKKVSLRRLTGRCCIKSRHQSRWQGWRIRVPFLENIRKDPPSCCVAKSIEKKIKRYFPQSDDCLQPYIKSFEKLAYKWLLAVDNEPLWLTEVHFLCDLSIKKGCLYIDLNHV